MRTIVIVALVAGCVGEAPPDRPDAALPPAPVTAALAVRTLEWFSTDALAIGAADVALEGTAPLARATSDAGGEVAVELAPGSVVVPVVARAGFRTTRNPDVLVLGDRVARDLHAVATAQVAQVYLAALGRAPEDGTAIAFADLRDHGVPMVGRPLAELALVTDAGEPVPALGPFVVAATAQVDTAATATAAAFGGRAVVTWLDCPAGAWRIAIAGALLPHRVVCEAGGATIVDTTRADEPVLPVRPTFTNDVFPRLNRPGLDERGLACTACHHPTAVADNLVPIAYDGIPSLVYANVIARGLVDKANPAQSLILRRPLYEVPPAAPDHPNATFIDERAFDYRVLLRWIEQGALE